MYHGIQVSSGIIFGSAYESKKFKILCATSERVLATTTKSVLKLSREWRGFDYRTWELLSLKVRLHKLPGPEVQVPARFNEQRDGYWGTRRIQSVYRTDSDCDCQISDMRAKIEE